MHCSLYVVMGDGASTLKLDIKDYMGSMLWPVFVLTYKGYS